MRGPRCKPVHLVANSAEVIKALARHGAGSRPRMKEVGRRFALPLTDANSNPPDDGHPVLHAVILHAVIPIAARSEVC